MKKLLILLCIVAYWACSNDDDTKIIKPEVSFSEFTDPRDMKVYKCITIGGQTWMAENLAYRIPQGSVYGCYTYKEEEIDTSRISVSVDLFKTAVDAAIARGELNETMFGMQAHKMINYSGKTTGKQVVDAFASTYSAYFPNTVVILNQMLKDLAPQAISESAAKAYTEAEYRNGDYVTENGLLYTLEAAKVAVPEGWRLPTDEDWKKLEETLGMPMSEIEKLDFWRGSEEGSVLKLGEEGCGFDIIFSGARLWGKWPAGTAYRDKGHRAYFWTSTKHVENDTTNYSITRVFAIDRNQILRGTSMPDAAYSVRCIKE